MKASVQYGDFKGTAAADIADYLGGNSLANVAKHFKLDESRFKLVGISFFGTEEFHVSLRCVDLQRSTPEKEHIVDLAVDESLSGTPLSKFFKRLHVSLHDRSDERYQNPDLDSDSEEKFEDYH